MQTKTKTRYRASARTQSRGTDGLTGAQAEPHTQPHHAGPSGPGAAESHRPNHLKVTGKKGILSVCLTEVTGRLTRQVVIAVKVWRGVMPESVTGVFYTKATPMCTL